MNRWLPAPLLSLALPYRSHLAALSRYRHDLQPLRLAVTLDRQPLSMVP